MNGEYLQSIPPQRRAQAIQREYIENTDRKDDDNDLMTRARYFTL